MALLHRDGQKFRTAFDKTAGAHEALLRRQLDERQLPEEDAVWSLLV